MAYMALTLLQQARQAFFDRHELPVGQVADTILKSWIRCTESGLDEGVEPLVQVDPFDLESARQRRETFMLTCAPELETLYLAARDMGGIVALTDDKGQILEVLGDNSFGGVIKTPSMRPGTDWSEPVRGTNAIGTALIEKRAVSVRGAEHFLRRYGQFSCAAMPVMDLGGHVLGVVNLTTPLSHCEAGAMGMVRITVEHIEHRLAVMGMDGCDIVRFHNQESYLDTAREGILALRSGNVVGCNRAALSLLGMSWSDLDGQALHKVFNTEADTTRLRSHSGREFACVWERRDGVALPSGVKNLAELEETLMRQVVEAHNGNISAAARHLGVHRSTLYRRLKLH